MFENPIIFAFSLTLLAGLSTGIGSAIAFFAKTTNTRFLAFSLGFSAGVMIYISFVELFAHARDSLVSLYDVFLGNAYTILAFFGGILFIGLIDKLVPSFENPHEIRGVEEMNDEKAIANKKLLRVGLFSALAIAIHNFPEGLATFISAIEKPEIGIAIAVAIAIHNIPEGIAVSVPLYYATGNKKKAFWLSFLSGLAEPVGALVGYLLLMPFLNDTVFGIIFAFIAGIMVFISLDELLPAAEKYGEHHMAIYGLVLGMMVMAGSLLMFV